MDEKEQKQLLMDLDVVMRSSDCPYIVQFYGALFREVSQHKALAVFQLSVLLYIALATQYCLKAFDIVHGVCVCV